MEQTIHEPLRFAQEVHPARFPVRMLRDVMTSPDGTRVVYSALGHIYAKRLPDGEPRRLTSDAAFEFDPGVLARWTVNRVHDLDRYGRRPRPHRPGRGRRGARRRDDAGPLHRAVVLARRPPGRRIGRSRAIAFRGPAYAVEPGLFVVDAAGSATPRLVREGGTDPQFDHTGKRLYFRERRDEKFVLASVELSGADEQVHFRSENATQIVPSPDGKWVAFAERYHAFVAAFPRSGRPVDLGPEVSAYPVARISRDAGMYLHWSGDSTRVLWALGPDLYSRDLSHTFTFLDSGREKPDEPEAKGVPIGFTAASDVPDGAVAIEGARLVTMAGGAGRSGGATTGVIENGTIVIEGNRIKALGPRRHGADPRRGRAHRRAGRDDHPGHRRRARARVGRKRWHPRRRRTGRCWPTWRTA